jgi:hypothetical protein
MEIAYPVDAANLHIWGGRGGHLRKSRAPVLQLPFRRCIEQNMTGTSADIRGIPAEVSCL